MNTPAFLPLPAILSAEEELSRAAVAVHFTLDGSSGADTLRQGEEAALQPEGRQTL